MTRILGPDPPRGADPLRHEDRSTHHASDLSDSVRRVGAVCTGRRLDRGRTILTDEPRRGSLEIPGHGTVSTLLDRPAGDSRALLVLAHGAGAGMEHAFMEALASRLRDRGVAVLRWQFPYMEAGSRRPDRPDVATDAVRAAALRGRELAGELPLFVGGKSFGARMTSTAASRGMLKDAEPAGLVHVGFPLHPAGKPGMSRADHLAAVPHPQLFLQGTRDALADFELMGTALEGLGEGAILHVVEGADHGFHVLKRSGRTDDQVLDELADEAVAWMRRLAPAAITGGDG